MVLFIKRCTLYSFAPIRKLRLSSVALLRIVFFPICVAKNYFKSSAIHSFKMLGISSSGTPFHTLPSAHHAAAPWSCPLQTLPKENGVCVGVSYFPWDAPDHIYRLFEVWGLPTCPVVLPPVVSPLPL